jgi:hypothetical protein
VAYRGLAKRPRGCISSKYDETFVISVSSDEAIMICKKALANIGYRIMNETSRSITCKEQTTFTMARTTWFAEIEMSLSETIGGTKILMNRSIFGLGPIQSGHLKGEVQRLKNLIEIESNQK